jgi:tripartite-type tricarboxylate transporter receptor subunit TctC
MKAALACIVGILVSSSSFGCALDSTKPIKLIVPFAAGGPADAGARLIVQKVTEVSSIPIVIDDRPGAGGTIGAAIAAKAPPDGCTLLLGSPGPITDAPSLYPNLSYDPVKSFIPIINAIASPFVLVVRPGLKANDVKQFVHLAGSKPGALTFGSAGNGSALHLAGESFNMTAGVKMTHVPYKGGGPAMNDLLAGRVDAMFADVSLALPQIKDGRIRPLAVTSKKRVPLLPQVPTLAESGYPDFEYETWSGVFAPAETPAPVVKALRAAFTKALSDPKLIASLAAQGNQVIAVDADNFAIQIKDGIRKVGTIVKAGHITVN